MRLFRVLIVFGLYIAWTALLTAADPLGVAFAADIPKEGRYDYTSCWSGVASLVEFSKTHSASNFEMTGTSRSNPPGGLGDKNSFRCVGLNYSFDGKSGGTVVCEAVDHEGDKRLTHFYFGEGRVVREQVAGTGKYDSMVISGSVRPLGPFPVIKPGMFQDCNSQTGTYKMK